MDTSQTTVSFEESETFLISFGKGNFVLYQLTHFFMRSDAFLNKQADRFYNNGIHHSEIKKVAGFCNNTVSQVILSWVTLKSLNVFK